jgi:hypothetical protein
MKNLQKMVTIYGEECLDFNVRHCKHGCFKQSNANKTEHRHDMHAKANILRITNHFESLLYNTEGACSPQ